MKIFEDCGDEKELESQVSRSMVRHKTSTEVTSRFKLAIDTRNVENVHSNICMFRTQTPVPKTKLTNRLVSDFSRCTGFPWYQYWMSKY